MTTSLRTLLGRARERIRIYENSVPNDADFEPEDDVDPEAVELTLAKRYGGPGPLPDPELDKIKDRRYPLHSPGGKKRPADATPSPTKDGEKPAKAAKDASVGKEPAKAPGSRT